METEQVLPEEEPDSIQHGTVEGPHNDLADEPQHSKNEGAELEEADDTEDEDEVE